MTTSIDLIIDKRPLTKHIRLYKPVLYKEPESLIKLEQVTDNGEVSHDMFMNVQQSNNLLHRVDSHGKSIMVCGEGGVITDSERLSTFKKMTKEHDRLRIIRLA